MEVKLRKPNKKIDLGKLAGCLLMCEKMFFYCKNSFLTLKLL